MNSSANSTPLRGRVRHDSKEHQRGLRLARGPITAGQALDRELLPRPPHAEIDLQTTTQNQNCPHESSNQPRAESE